MTANITMTNRAARRPAALLLVILVTAAQLMGFVPSAEASADSAGFDVKAQLPANQLDDSHSYFDLLVKPGGEQVLNVTVNNSDDEQIVVDVSAISASTNANGIIDYSTPGIKDETLKHPFSEISDVLTDELVIPPGESAMARVKVTMPDDSYDGVILGGLVFSRRPDSPQPEGGGETGSLAPGSSMTITNVYSYILAVKLTENTGVTVMPEFELLSVTPDQVNYYAEVVHEIRNSQAAIAKNINLDIRVYSETKKEDVITYSTGNIDMAPNSVMALGLRWEDGKAVPGKYISYVGIELNGRTWELEKSFEITGEEASEINDGANVIEKEKEPFPYMLLLIIFGFLILLLLFIIILILLRRRRDDEDSAKPDDNAKPKS